MSNLKINEPDVVSETIDGETVVVSLSTGSYYSLEGAATAVWNLIESHCSVEQIMSAVLQQFEGESQTIRTSVKALIDQLQLEKLIVEYEDDTESSLPLSIDAEPKSVFVMPNLQKFSDMQELLLLDPIHEVDAAAGWPAKGNEPTHAKA
ncbi:MAG: PqqD family protein [Cyanobacteria bacterium P01_D01_bin.105]